MSDGRVRYAARLILAVEEAGLLIHSDDDGRVNITGYKQDYQMYQKALDQYKHEIGYLIRHAVATTDKALQRITDMARTTLRLKGKAR